MIETPAIGVKRQSKRSVSPRLLLALSLAALALAVAASLTLLARPRRQVRRLPDGTHVTLQSVTYGSEHSFDPRPWWVRTFNLRSIPLSNRPIYKATVVLPPDSMAFWVDHDVKKRGTFSAPGYGVITDSHGCWFEATSSESHAFSSTWTSHLRAIGFSAFPRRERMLRFGLYDSYGRGPAASFGTPNPGPQSFPTWKPGQSAPVTVKRGDLEFTLQRLIHRQVNLRNHEAAVFHITKRGRPQTDWWATVITVRDATGNVATTGNATTTSNVAATYIRRSRLRDGTVRFAGLCRQEAAWKLEVIFERIRSGRALETRTVEFLVRP